MKKDIQMIAFDLFGVIISEGHMVSNVLMPLLGYGADKTTVKNHYRHYTNGETVEQTFWQSIGFEDIPAELRQSFLGSFELDHEAIPVITALQKHYQLAILSNLAKDWGDELSEKFAFRQHFSPLIISGEAGCGKPDPAIYQQLLNATDIPASQIAFIDDRLENLATAHDLGISTIHYDREPDARSFQPDATIRRLGELVDLLPGQYQPAH